MVNTFFDELSKKIQASIAKRVEAVKAGVTVDTGVRLALFCAARVLDPEELEAIFQNLQETLPHLYEGEAEKELAVKTLADLRKAILTMRDPE